ncbi:MAG: tetratricopeptide repeat protein [bacterium]|nr:tetratricopeptide repeat protein [bacterium]
MSALAHKERFAERQFERALESIKRGDYLGAVEQLEEVLRNAPKHFRAAYNLALSLQRQGLLQRAAEAYERALAIEPRDEAALCNLAVLMEQTDRPHRALELFERALKVNERNLQALKGLSLHRYLRGEYEAAEEVLDRALDLEANSPWALEQKGLLAHAQNDWERAIECYSKALDIDNSNPSIWNNLGNAYVKAFQVPEAENAYRQSLSIDSSLADTWFNLGELLFHSTTKAEAVEPFARVVELNPKDLEAWTFLAQAQAEARPAEAEASFLKVIELGGENQRVLKSLSKLYAQSGAKDKELEVRAKLSKHNPYDMDNNFAIAQIRLNQGRPEVAYKLLQDCLTISEQEYETWYRLAQSFQLEKKLEEEFNCLEQVIKANPAHHAAWTRLGHVALEKDLPLKAYQYFIKAAPALKNDYQLWKRVMVRLCAEERFEEALDACDQVFELAAYSPAIWEDFYRHFKSIGQDLMFVQWLELRLFQRVGDAQYSLPFGRLLINFGRPEMAEQLYQHLLKKYPQHTEIHYQLAQFYLEREQPLAARSIAESGLRNKPADYQLVLVLGDAAYLEHKYDDAQRAFEKALSLRRDDWRVWFSLGNIAARKDRLEEALEGFSQALDIYDQEPRSYFNRGLALRRLKRPKDAALDFRRALRLDRKHFAAWSALGGLALEREDWHGARRYYLRALAANRKYPVAWNNLAHVFEQLGQTQKASACLEQAQKLAP